MRRPPTRGPVPSRHQLRRPAVRGQVRMTLSASGLPRASAAALLGITTDSGINTVPPAVQAAAYLPAPPARHIGAAAAPLLTTLAIWPTTN
jgi:hypothetical protein